MTRRSSSSSAFAKPPPLGGPGAEGAPPSRTSAEVVFPTSSLEPLPVEFFAQRTTDVARQLLGRYLVRALPDGSRLIARLVETEAYVGPEDLASHSSHGLTHRTAPMFEAAGRAYVYRVYGMYWCLNVVTEGAGRGSAVLLRGAEPITGLTGRMDGPGRLCRTLDLDGSWNRADLTRGPLILARGDPVPQAAIAASPRIGVGYAAAWADAPLRFFDATSKHVSRAPRRAPGRPEESTR